MPDQRTALIIDHDRDIAHALSQRLTAAGFRVLTRTSSCDVLRSARYPAAELVIIEAELMPMNPNSVARLIRSFKARADTVVALITDGRMTRKQAFQLGADHRIRKPRVVEGVLALVDSGCVGSQVESAHADCCGELRVGLSRVSKVLPRLRPNLVTKEKFAGGQRIDLEPTKQGASDEKVSNSLTG